MNPAPTLEDVARRAGVSRATASRVVRGDDLVSPDKVEQVRQAVRELGYVPNRAARTLVTRRTDAIALVVPEPDTRVFTDPFFGAAIAGVNQALADTQMQLIMVLSQPGEAERHHERLRRFLGNHHADGLLVMSLHADDALAAALAASTVPVVFHGRPVNIESAHCVDVDNVEGGRIAGRALMARGCQRVATIAGPADMAAALDRRDGWHETLAGAGLGTDRVAEGDFTFDSGAAAMETLLAHHPGLDGVFAANDAMALGAMRVLAEHGLSVPDDVAVVGYDDTPMAARHEPRLTTVTNPAVEVASRATTMLLDLIEQRPVESPVVLTPELVPGETC